MKLSYVHGVGTTPLIADTIGGALNSAAEHWGDRDALVACHQQLRYSYRELRDEADRAARALIALGVQRGDRVGILSGNRAEWMVTQYAAAKAGAVLVNINPAYRLRELEYALTHSGASVLIAARRFRSTDYVEMLPGLMPELTSTGTGLIQAQRVPALRRLIYLGTDAGPGGIAWGESLDLGNRVSARDLEARETALQFDDPTVGRVLPLLECKIVDQDTGMTVPRGIPGELCTRGYAVMLGYWNDDASTGNAIDAACWTHSGDLAVMNDEGYVSITGRIKDMIIRGGENIYPREIEEFLHTHEKIRDVQVIGVPDDKYGEEVCAWIRLRDGVTATAEEFREFCRGQIATYKIPRYIRFTNEFPMTVTGKVQKFKMRELTVAEMTSARVTDVEPT